MKDSGVAEHAVPDGQDRREEIFDARFAEAARDADLHAGRGMQFFARTLHEFFVLRIGKWLFEQVRNAQQDGQKNGQKRQRQIAQVREYLPIRVFGEGVAVIGNGVARRPQNKRRNRDDEDVQKIDAVRARGGYEGHLQRPLVGNAVKRGKERNGDESYVSRQRACERKADAQNEHRQRR